MEIVSPSLGLFFWQTFIFLVVLFVLGKFAWKPILSALHERETGIEQALEAAKSAKAEMEQLKAGNEQLLAEARQERDRILKDAHAAASQLISEAKDRATAETNRGVDNARQAIENEKEAAKAHLRNFAAEIGVGIAEKILRRDLGGVEAQRQLVDEYLNDFNRN
jgi:F-type H+-transporting ATPase subunit b